MNIEKYALETEKPLIFDESKIVAGVTKRNFEAFPPVGFNISYSAGIERKEVDVHRAYLAGHIDVDPSVLKFQKQIHSSKIWVVDSDSPELESDGMITADKGLILCVSIADCAALLIHDPRNKLIAGVHSGWRGTMANITGKCIHQLGSDFGSSPEDLETWISPCASGEAYEVGWDVAQYFPDSIKPRANGKFLFDNKNEIKNQLLNCGVPVKSIEISEVCTINNMEYHSYRRDKGRSGRMAAFIGLKY